MKLTVELVPSTSWCSNVRSVVAVSDWDILRKLAYKNNKHTCEICNESGVFQGFNHPVECHEIWNYDDINHIQTLVGLIALCPLCHKAKHLGRTLSVNDEYTDAVLNKFMILNDMSVNEANEYIIEAFKQHKLRSEHSWTVDISFINHLLGRPYVPSNKSTVNTKMPWDV